MLTICHLVIEQRTTAERVKYLFYMHILHTLFNLKQKHVSKVSTPVPIVWLATNNGLIAANFDFHEPCNCVELLTIILLTKLKQRQLDIVLLKSFQTQCLYLWRWTSGSIKKKTSLPFTKYDLRSLSLVWTGE